MAKLTELGWILRGAFGVSRQLITASAFSVHANEQETFDLQTIYESGENVAEKHHRKTVMFNDKKKKWGAAAYQLGNTSSRTITEVKQR